MYYFLSDTHRMRPVQLKKECLKLPPSYPYMLTYAADAGAELYHLLIELGRELSVFHVYVVPEMEVET
jgi:hypothetical protein